MSPLVRPATPPDVPAIVALLMQGARERSASDPPLWRIASDAPARLRTAITAALGGANTSARELWLVAEHAGRVAGVTHAMMLPVPPIYSTAAGLPGLLLDDCFTAADAPAGTAEKLLVATEAVLRTIGAARLVASCPAAGPWRSLYEGHGYEPVTLYLAKHGFAAGAFPPRVRPAGADDVPGIVTLSARHRKTLTNLNARFWHIHPEADARFESWMRKSLTFKDRDMFVAGGVGEVRGYVIAQPASPLIVPMAHPVAGLGVIDDFYAEDFANAAAPSHGGAIGEALLTAAERAFARRGVGSALVVCPAAWSTKVSLLERNGYRTAKVWMLKA